MVEPDVPADHNLCWCQLEYPTAMGACGMRWSTSNPGEPFPVFPLPVEESAGAVAA